MNYASDTMRCKAQIYAIEKLNYASDTMRYKAQIYVV